MEEGTEEMMVVVKMVVVYLVVEMVKEDLVVVGMVEVMEEDMMVGKTGKGDLVVVEKEVDMVKEEDLVAADSVDTEEEKVAVGTEEVMVGVETVVDLEVAMVEVAIEVGLVEE